MNSLKIASAEQIAQARALANTYPVDRVTLCDCCGDMHLCHAGHDSYDVPICFSCLVDGILANNGLRLATSEERAAATIQRLALESAAGFGL